MQNDLNAHYATMARLCIVAAMSVLGVGFGPSLIETLVPTIVHTLVPALRPEVIGARNLTFSYKMLPTECTMAEATKAMKKHWRHSFNVADSLVTFGAETYHGNKQKNTQDFHLRTIYPDSTSTQGRLQILVQDAVTTTADSENSPGAVGVSIDAITVPRSGKQIDLANVTLTIVENNTTVRYRNNSDPNSYFRLVLTSVDRMSGTASGWFEGLVQAQSGPHAGRIYAITDGDFVMDINY